jgi:hypothetical protein
MGQTWISPSKQEFQLRYWDAPPPAEGRQNNRSFAPGRAGEGANHGLGECIRNISLD